VGLRRTQVGSGKNADSSVDLGVTSLSRLFRRGRASTEVPSERMISTEESLSLEACQEERFPDLRKGRDLILLSSGKEDGDRW